MGIYGGVVVTVNVKHKDGTEEKYSVVGVRTYFEMDGIDVGDDYMHDNIASGGLCLIERISGDYETDNSVKLSNDAVYNYCTAR